MRKTNFLGVLDEGFELGVGEALVAVHLVPNAIFNPSGLRAAKAVDGVVAGLHGAVIGLPAGINS